MGKQSCLVQAAVGMLSLPLAPRAIALDTGSFQGLGDLPGGVFVSEAYAVSDGGAVVVGYSRSASGNEAFRWTFGDGMTGLGDLPGSTFDSFAAGISNDGTVIVGGGRSTSGPEAFRWTDGGGMVGLGDLAGGNFASVARAVSDDGAVVAGYSNPQPTDPEPFRWTNASGMTSLGFLPGHTRAHAFGVGGNGSVVIGHSRDGGNLPEAFRWTAAGGMVGLGDLPGGTVESQAYAVSDDGLVVVGGSRSDLGFQAYRWTQQGGMIGLGDLPSGNFSSFARGVNGDGTVVVGVGTTANGPRAFIWDTVHGMRNLRTVLVNDFGLDLFGWTLDAATGISSDGTAIVGYGTNPDGETEAWLATLSDPISVPPNGYFIDRGTRISGNVLSIAFTDGYTLKIASEAAAAYHTADTIVRTTTPDLTPSRVDVRTETRAAGTGIRTRISIWNFDTGTWTVLGTFDQPNIDAVYIFNDLENPESYVRTSDTLVRVRVQSFRPVAQGPFNQFIDHVAVTVHN